MPNYLKKTTHKKIETFCLDVLMKEKTGFVSETFFCNKYNITESIFTRWVMKIHYLRVTAGFSNIRYKESDLLSYLHDMK